MKVVPARPRLATTVLYEIRRVRVVCHGTAEKKSLSLGETRETGAYLEANNKRRRITCFTWRVSVSATSGHAKSKKKDDMEELQMGVDVRGTAGALIANDDTNMTWKKVSVTLFSWEHFVRRG